jgi:hypothetical protein
MNPVPPLVSLLAIAAGVWGGFALGAAATPELPDDAIDPGVTVSETVRGGDPESLFLAGPLSAALDQTLEQFPAGETVSNVTIEPGQLRANAAEGPNVLPLEDLPVGAPETMIAGINELRKQAGTKPVTLDDVNHYSWSPANPTNVEWSVLLDITTAGPPTQFSANRDGTRVRVGP